MFIALNVVLNTTSCHYNSNNDSVIIDSTFFTYYENSNILIQFLGNNNVILDYEDTVRNCKLLSYINDSGKIDSNCYVICHKDTCLLLINISDEMYINNQQYDVDGGMGKIVKLEKLYSIKSSEYKNYYKSNQWLWDDDEYDGMDNLLNKARYLAQYQDYELAIFLFKEYINRITNNAQVYLNLADCYYNFNKIDQAKANYKIYINKMKEQDELSKIHSYVFDRVK